MRIGFWKEDITPEIGVELGGYAGYRPCTQIHDPLWCRTVVLEQQGKLYSFVQLDLMCADEPFCRQIGCRLEQLGVAKERLIVSSIHSHCAPCGAIPGEGLMGDISLPGYPKDDTYIPYLDHILQSAYLACEKAIASLEPFSVRTGSSPAPPVGSERHTGSDPKVQLTVVQCKTDSGRNLILYHFPCHPTVMGPDNLAVTSDFAAAIEPQLDADVAVFLNGAAGDISTRYTRRAQTFEECARLGTVAADAIRAVLQEATFRNPSALRGINSSFAMAVRPVEPVEEASRRLEELTAKVIQAEREHADAATIRTLKSYAEGAGINLQFAKSLGDLQEIIFRITVFCFAGQKFVTIPGELFSTLQPEDGTCVIGYANGYNLYIADQKAYDALYYEALASLFARGEGERLMNHVKLLLRQLDE